MPPAPPLPPPELLLAALEAEDDDVDDDDDEVVPPLPPAPLEADDDDDAVGPSPVPDEVVPVTAVPEEPPEAHPPIHESPATPTAPASRRTGRMPGA